MDDTGGDGPVRYTRATRVIWEGAGSPAPVDGDGVLLAPQPGAPEGCSMCGDPEGRWVYGDVFSENFWPARAIDRLFPYGGRHVCAACVWCARALALRCAPFFATPRGVWFVTRRSLLAALLDPPDAPFVAGAPLYGAAHGGEAHAWRCAWPGAPPLPPNVDRLTRLQAKHVAVYAEIAWSRERYVLQVDDIRTVVVDVALWRGLAARLGAIAARLRALGLGSTDVRDAMRTLRPPPLGAVLGRLRAAGVSTAPAMRVLGDWPALVRGLDRHAAAQMWPILTDLVPLPEAPPRPEPAPKATSPKTSKRPRRGAASAIPLTLDLGDTAAHD